MIRGRSILNLKNVTSSFDALNEAIVSCDQCPRLRNWCSNIAHQKRKQYATHDYWGLPVPNFGDPEAKGLIVGLAPAAHGANRTGRMFTGDRSGDWLYKSLYKFGLCSSPKSVSVGDRLVCHGISITAVCHCAPPDNKPTREEISNCHTFLAQTLSLLAPKAILCLGGLAWEEVSKLLATKSKHKFGHGASYRTHHDIEVFASYHPSQQNTFTGRLTESMLDSVIQRFAESIRSAQGH